jgi:hypothetical protein
MRNNPIGELEAGLQFIDLRVRAANAQRRMFLTREARVSKKPRVKRSGTRGKRQE